MYWSDVSTENFGLTLITHGLQGVSGAARRGVMLVREVTKDEEGLTDPGIHHLRYAYLPHTGTAADAQPWLAAYEFNQPLIATWNIDGQINIQLPFDDTMPLRQFENVMPASTLPLTSSLLSAQNAIIADLYWKGDQIEAIILDYDLTDSATLQTQGQLIPLPQSVFMLMPLSPSSITTPLQK
jgi:hypothetical protein